MVSTPQPRSGRSEPANGEGLHRRAPGDDQETRDERKALSSVARSPHPSPPPKGEGTGAESTPAHALTLTLTLTLTLAKLFLNYDGLDGADVGVRDWLVVFA